MTNLRSEGRKERRGDDVTNSLRPEAGVVCGGWRVGRKWVACVGGGFRTQFGSLFIIAMVIAETLFAHASER